MDSDFDKITATITANEKYENIVHDVCHLPKVTSLKEFLRLYENEEKAIDEGYDHLSNVAPTIEHFEDAFKRLEEYPPNLQKLKKPMRERLNSNVSKSSPALNDSSSYTTNKENSMSSLNLNKFGNVPTASETLSNFIKFQKQLKQLHAEITHQDAEEEYVDKLNQLAMFSQQLEKLLPTEIVGKSALSQEEENILEDLVNRMDDLNFIRSHHNVVHQQSTLINSVTPKLDSLVDILSCCLLAVNEFNIN